MHHNLNSTHPFTIRNCQKIQPIIDEDGDVHYEILLTVLGENDEPMPPQEFIIAAETYNRMGAIDRWVIKNAFEFIAGHGREIVRFGSLADLLGKFSLTSASRWKAVIRQADF